MPQNRDRRQLNSGAEVGRIRYLLSLPTRMKLLAVGQFLFAGAAAILGVINIFRDFAPAGLPGHDLVAPVATLLFSIGLLCAAAFHSLRPPGGAIETGVASRAALQGSVIFGGLGIVLLALNGSRFPVLAWFIGVGYVGTMAAIGLWWHRLTINRPISSSPRR